MISRVGKLNILLKELDWLNIQNFTKRKILQKTIYILIEMGMKFTYNYNWYVHGPYSPELADDAYEIQYNQNYYDRETSRYHFKNNAIAKINNFKHLFEGREEDEEWLEIISSLLFLKRNYKLDADKLKELFLERKKKFKEKDEIVVEAIKFI